MTFSVVHNCPKDKNGEVVTYSDLPNNCAANLIIYTTLLGPTCLLISGIFPSKPDFHPYK